jgi:hypothetical protein
MSERLKNLEDALVRLQEKKHKVVFLIPDTNGIARASIAISYKHAMALHKQGIAVVMLHDKKDYMGVGAWLGEEYETLTHTSIESNQLEVSASDFLVIPELYGNVVEKVEHLPCQKIIFVQSLEYMLDTYAPGKTWLDYGVLETMTTSKEAKDYIQDLMYVTNVKVVPIGVSDAFKPFKRLKKPVIAIHCKDTRKTAKLLKMFYIKYPYLRWLTFRDMHGMTENDFARNLSECILAVWSDQSSTFPLFLVEALKCDVPVVAQMPQLLFDWTTDDVATWAMTDAQIVELIARYVKTWMEDNVPEEFEHLDKLVEGKFTMTEMEEAITKVYGEYLEERIDVLSKVVTKAQEAEAAKAAEAETNNTETPQTDEEKS